MIWHQLPNDCVKKADVGTRICCIFKWKKSILYFISKSLRTQGIMFDFLVVEVGPISLSEIFLVWRIRSYIL